ncbi:HIT family protein [Pseudomonas asuensis]|uniref:HIT family protein n=1 Tax=Pseudomonas asuensis TaxID=1825787 RepID=A0ABQ2GLQ6_9PSED|nr:HIT family protein [Pseudomonas asuensis]GGM01467.1 HIT family protein [Pseudomonas asuensis]
MESTDALNATMKKFGAPGSVIRDYQYWSVQLRPQQVTLGSLVLIAKEEATAFAELSPAAFTELKTVTTDIESTLKGVFNYSKLNYLMLMMVDPHVHFHVIPRYNSPRTWADQEFSDSAWPGPPQLSSSIELQEVDSVNLRDELMRCWPC